MSDVGPVIFKTQKVKIEISQNSNQSTRIVVTICDNHES